MNRLIIIGNGFDLAHGLKTSYRDFCTDYLRSCIKNSNYGMEFIDKISKWRKNYHESFKPEGDIFTFIQNQVQNGLLSYEFHSPFARKLFQKVISDKWVDIESLYFQEIIKHVGIDKIDITKINSINESFRLIKDEIVKYLNSQSSSVYIKEYEEIFKESINFSDFIEPVTDSPKPEDLLFLNFNYTSTLEPYLNYLHGTFKSIEHIQIHGDLHKPNEIIFGYGDESDKSFEKFSDSQEPELLCNLKTFGYLQNDKYRRLFHFINKKAFQIYVLGHSLGISDRTLLNEVFDHNNCKSIKIF